MTAPSSGSGGDREGVEGLQREICRCGHVSVGHPGGGVCAARDRSTVCGCQGYSPRPPSPSPAPPDGLSELGEVLLAPCGDCGHWPGDHHVDSGCKVCRCGRDMLAVEVANVEESSWLAAHRAAAVEEGKTLARTEEWPHDRDGHRWRFPAQRALLTQAVDALLRDVFQRRRSGGLREHMLGVVVKVSNRSLTSWWADEHLAEVEAAAVEEALRRLLRDLEAMPWGETARDDMLALVREQVQR